MNQRFGTSSQSVSFRYWVSEGFVFRRMTVVVERVRLRIVEKIRYADLTSIEMMGKAPTYNAVSSFR